jgi:hypothetical protein
MTRPKDVETYTCIVLNRRVQLALTGLRFFSSREQHMPVELLSSLKYALMASIPPLRNRGGRPRKHIADADAAAATRESKLRFYHRSKLNGPADFIAYEPPPPELPTDTPPTGVRTSPDIHIPLDNDGQQDDMPGSPNPSTLPTATRRALRDDDDEVAAQIKQIQIDEQESNLERGEYDTAISQRLGEIEAAAARTLLDLRSANTTSGAGVVETSVLERVELPTDPSTAGLQEDSDKADNGGLAYDTEPLLSCFSRDGRIAAATPNRPASIERSPESTVPLHTRKTPPPPSSNQSTSRQSSGKRSKSFPVQKNNLMAWVTSLPERHANPARTPPSLSALCSPRSVSSSSPSRANGSAPDPHSSSNPPVPGSSPAPPVAAPPSRAPPSTTSDTGTSERTAIKLARQLRNFQGCTHEEHREADRLHQEHHQRPDVHSKCSSLQEVTELLRGNGGGSPIPDVLAAAKSMKSLKMMKPTDFAGLDCKAAFEGISSDDIGTRDENLPRSLCLSQYHTSSRKNRRAIESFDIDSTCCFPTSLAVARQGIYWFPAAHPFLNLTADIHFGLRVPSYNIRGARIEKHTPLHKIPHYCFGSLIGMTVVDILFFFPMLHADSDHEHSTFLSKEDHELLYDGILAPCLHKVIRSSNILLHIPASARIANADAIALSAENFARKDSARQQLLNHPLQPQYLDGLWVLIQETIAENPLSHRFQGVTLFMHAKNTKLETMVERDLTAAFDGWFRSWAGATDPQFYNKDRTFVDLAKQVTSEDSDLPYDQLPEDHEAEVYLWKKCCLDAHAKTRILLNADGSPAKRNPKRTTYVWATMRDTIGQTFFATPQSREAQDGQVYSQFYALVKNPFDTSKVYIFANESLENLALDPGYIRSLQQQGGSITFSKRVCELSFLHSKNRAYVNLVDNGWKSIGVREEHRISLTMMEEIYQQWRQWDLYDDEAESSRPLPYYIIPTKDLLDFLYTQINKYCFLFEHVLAHTAMTYSLPETIVMVTALRALRFCYSSNLLQRESLLYKDRWEVIRNGRPVIKEGLGMQETIERCGLGWFLPKFNWATWRFAPPHGENILVGNMLMHEEYKRRWRAVKDLRDVYVRFSQAEAWYDRYNVRANPPLLAKWLEYLHALNLEQFDTDVWKAMLKSNKRTSELAPDAVARQGEIQFCHHSMKRIFSINGTSVAPHFVTGNKMRFERVGALLNFLFLWEDGEDRAGWGHKPYRTILQKTFELIERRLGNRRANLWLDEFFHLVRLTHWVLPYATNTALISSTKTSHSQHLQGRMMWFSAVYANPAVVALPFQSQPRTLYDILWAARQEVFGDSRDQHPWGTSQLIKACCSQGLKMVGPDDTEDFWVVGRKSDGLKGFLPLWERTRPPRLTMMEQIKGKSLDELEDLISGFSRDSAVGPEEDSAADSCSDDDDNGTDTTDGYRSDKATNTARSIMAQFARSSSNDRVRRSVVVAASNTAVVVSPGRLSSTGSSIIARFARKSAGDFTEASRSSVARSSGSEFIPSSTGRE